MSDTQIDPNLVAESTGWKVYTKAQAQKEIRKLHKCRNCGFGGKPKFKWYEDKRIQKHPTHDRGESRCVYANGFALSCPECESGLGFVAVSPLYIHETADY